MNTESQDFIRERNRSLVLKTLIESAPLSRADLAKHCHLTKATISTIIQELLDASLVLEIGNGDTAHGRKPILLKFHQTCGYVIAIDIGVQSYTALIADLKGEHRSIREYHREGYEISQTEISSLIHHILRGIPEAPYGVVGICLGVYGVVNGREVLFTPHYHLEHKKRLCEALEEEFHIPFFIENDANLSVLGESLLYPDYPNMIFLNIHSGIGSGIFLDGKIFRGRHGYAGEIGHTIIVPNGRSCSCGNKGCLEQYASETAILTRYAQKKQLSFVTAEKFVRDYYNQDALAVSLIEEFCLYLSISINNLIFTYNPELILLSSYFTEQIPSLCQKITQLLEKGSSDSVILLSTNSAKQSELLGGASMCAQNFIYGNSQNLL